MTTSRGTRPGSTARPGTLVTLLTLVMTIDYADRTVLSAMGPTIKRVFSLSNTRYGLLSAVLGIVGALATVPAGALVDRVRRTRLLAGSVGAWSLAMLSTGAATSFSMLLGSRMVLGVVAATVGPAFPSLAGDAVAPRRRGAFLGRVESGQFLGSAAGVSVGAVAVTLLGWRWGFWLLMLPRLLLARRLLREPDPERQPARGAAAELSMGGVFGYLIGHRTPWLVLLAVTAANAFLAAVSAFAVIFAVGQYHVGTGVADLALLGLGGGALAGVWIGGAVNHGLLRAGRPVLRLPLIAAACAVTSLLWLPALLTSSLPLTLPFLVAGSFALASALPALDAVRVEVLPSPVRGRAESARTLMRTVVEGGVPAGGRGRRRPPRWRRCGRAANSLPAARRCPLLRRRRADGTADRAGELTARSRGQQHGRGAG